MNRWVVEQETEGGGPRTGDQGIRISEEQEIRRSGEQEN